jgi:ketosteroid isomerase-like protein
MTNRYRIIVVAITLAVSALQTARLCAQPENDSDLLLVRESVWRAWFAGDIASLRELVPAETIVMSSDQREWKHQSAVLESAADFHSHGGKLVRLEFPRTEVQHFGDVAIVWSDFLVESEIDGKRSVATGRASEVFVRRNGRWLNPGWHTDNVK